jgi:membrane-associated protein
VAEDWIRELAASPWLLPALFLMVVGDAFVVVLPSETLVVALGTLAAATGSPSLWAVIPVAAVGAVVGDSSLFWIGRRIGVTRWRWQRSARIAPVLERTRGTVLQRPAVLVFTARYIPFARIAVNLSAGAAGLPYRTFLPLSAAAGLGWACLNAGVGAAFGAALGQHPLIAVVCSVVCAIALGLAVDAIVRKVSSWRRARRGDAV